MKQAAVLLLALSAAPLSAQQPQLGNARLIARSAGPDLHETIATIVKEQVEPAWIGYTVPVVSDRDEGTRFDAWSERCRLEQGTPTQTPGVLMAGPVKLEAASTVAVLYRVQDRELRKIRTLSSDCQIDGGGLPMYWIDGVTASQSTAMLKPVIGDPTLRPIWDAALAAIALHRDAAASAALIDLARNSREPHVRERALFWIARRAESQAIPAITDAIDHDPEVAVKRQAVFALSQLPRGEGVPLLIRLAQSSPSPVVRERAMFWLGQSKDPRALELFERILH